MCVTTNANTMHMCMAPDTLVVVCFHQERVGEEDVQAVG